MSDWTMNTSQLAKGMLIRRPGLDEALEVVNIRDDQAKIKLPGGKTSTIPASAEVEWCWPEASASKVLAGNAREKFEKENPQFAAKPGKNEDQETESDIADDWQSDWELLDIGLKIQVLGEHGDFTVLRLTGSEARIKSDTTAQIKPLTVGHKFKIVGGSGGKVKESKPDVKSGKLTKSDKARKARSGKGAKAAAPEPEAEPENDEDSQPAPFNTESEEIDPIPSDEELAEIENGTNHDSGDDDETDLAGNPFDNDLESNDDDTDDDTDDNDQEDVPMPKTAKSVKPSRSASTPASDSGSLLTLGQIADRTGISYPTLIRYVRDHGKRLPSEGEGRSRRYYPDAIDIFREIRSETKGGRKPGSGSGSSNKTAATATRKPKPVSSETSESDRPTPARRGRPAKSRQPLSTGTSFSGSSSTSTGINPGSAQTSNATIDSMLSKAIDHANAQISVLTDLVENLEAQRENLKLWS